MGLHQHQHRDGAQDHAIGDQLREADPPQEGDRAAQVGAGIQLFGLLGVPLAQAGREVQDDADLGDLRGLEVDGSQLEPALGAHCGLAEAQRGEHQQEEHIGRRQHAHRHPPEGLVVDLGDDIQGQDASYGEARLLHEVIGGVVVGRLGVIERRGIRGGEHHDHADHRQHEDQHEEGHIHRPVGQLFLDGPVALCFPSHGPASFRSKTYWMCRVTRDSVPGSRARPGHRTARSHW